MKKLVNGCFGNIYYATVNEEKGTMSNKVDVTDDAIRCVFQWFIDKMEYGDENNKAELSEYSINYPDIDFELTMTKKRR